MCLWCGLVVTGVRRKARGVGCDVVKMVGTALEEQRDYNKFVRESKKKKDGVSDQNENSWSS